MSNKLFEAVKEGHDGKARIVLLCQDPQGFYVFKPATGFKTKHWLAEDDAELISCFERQVSCTQNNGFLEPGEGPAANENYSLEVTKPIGSVEKTTAVVGLVEGTAAVVAPVEPFAPFEGTVVVIPPVGGTAVVVIPVEGTAAAVTPVEPIAPVEGTASVVENTNE